MPRLEFTGTLQTPLSSQRLNQPCFITQPTLNQYLIIKYTNYELLSFALTTFVTCMPRTLAIYSCKITQVLYHDNYIKLENYDTQIVKMFQVQTSAIAIITYMLVGVQVFLSHT